MDENGLWPVRCEILAALYEAEMEDGTVSDEIRARMGANQNEDRYCWPCNEVEWTDEWKAEFRRRRQGAVGRALKWNGSTWEGHE
jgi:hypothetical protein